MWSTSGADLDLTLSIVNWNTADRLIDCLDSIFRHPPARDFEVIVVDNASRDDSVARVRAAFPQVRVIALRRNLGYAGGHNQALRVSRGRFILLLNSDIVVHEGALEALLSFMEVRPEAGLAGAQLLWSDGSVQLSYTDDLTLRAVFLQQFGLDRLFPHSRLTAGYWRGHEDHSQVRAVPQLSGACLLLRREVLQQVGLLDEGFFMYCEDTDYCTRVRRAGWQLYYVPTARMTHFHGQSARQVPAAMIASHGRACVRYFRRHRNPLEAALCRGLVVAGAGLRWMAWSALAWATPGGASPARQQAQLFSRVLRALLGFPRPSPEVSGPPDPAG
jgi:N-acetylglucosaminyl-diphospho-decaprenol L-rhamnosyltransferase